MSFSFWDKLKNSTRMKQEAAMKVLLRTSIRLIDPHSNWYSRSSPLTLSQFCCFVLQSFSKHFMASARVFVRKTFVSASQPIKLFLAADWNKADSY